MNVELPGTEQLFDEVPCGIVVTDVGGGILRVNRSFCTWSGYAADELVGRMKLQDLFTVGGRIFHQTHWLPMLQMQGSLSEVKFDLRRKSGELLTIMLNAVRRSHGASVHDQITITVAEERNKYERQLVLARQRADELSVREVQAQRVLRIADARLRQAMRVGALHLWDVDAAGERHYEASVADLLGVSLEQLAPDTFAQAVLAEDRQAEEDAFRLALREPDKVHSWTFRLRRADGAVRVMLSSGQAFYDEDGSLFEFVGVLRDITETARLRADAEDRALFAEQMVGIVSHDLRNPLSAIMVGSMALKRGATLSPKLARILDSMLSAGNRAKRLIEDLLDFTCARVGQGLSVSARPVDLHEIVAKCVEEMQLAFPDHSFLHLAQGEGPCTADPDRISQLLGNLIGNAAVYGRPDRPITITSSLGDAQVCLSVHNEGEQIDPALLPTIFEAMVRGGNERSSVRSVGLGLFIVRAIAQAHAGSMSVVSTAARGTLFTFCFDPRALAAARSEP